MKINFFTPLPPAATDIASCVARSAAPLAEAFDLTFWTDADRVDSSMRRIAPVRTFSPGEIDWRALNYADFNIYNVGNDPSFHAAIMEVAHRFPGIVILHDACVHELAHGTLQRGAAPIERYLELLRAEGPEALAAGRSVVEGRATLQSISARYPLASWALQGALAVVTHNGLALRAAMPDLRIPVLETPLPWLPREKMPSPRSRQIGRKLEMAICGFLNSPNRRLSETLEALAAFPDKERILLHIAGRVKDKEALDRKIGALGLKGIVKLHGYLSESALAQLLDRAHLSVNLRWPSMGEASGSQLRFWNHSLPTIATATGWYAAQPEGTLHLVRPEYEREDLHRLWKAALDDYSAFAQTGLAGRKLLESRHSAEVFAAALSDFLPTVAAYRSRAFAPVLAERAGAAASAFGLEAEALDLLSHSTGRAIADLAGLSVQRTAP